MLRMRYGLEWLWAFYRSPKGKKLYRYVMGSVITTIVSFAVLTLVYGVFRWWGAVASTVFANVVATVPAYWLNRTWTWGKDGRSDIWREVVPFWVLSIAGIAISMVTADLAAEFGRAHDLHHLVELVVVDGANLAAYGVLFIGKYLVFNHLFRLAESVRSTGPEPGPAGGSPLPTRIGFAVGAAAEPAGGAQIAAAGPLDACATVSCAATPPGAAALVPAGARSSGSGLSFVESASPWATVRASAVLAHPAGRAVGVREPEPPSSVYAGPSSRPPTWLANLVARWTVPARRSGETDLVGMSSADP